MMDDPSKWVFESGKHDSVRHMEERSINGFSTYDWWNFCDYIAWVNIQALEKFQDGAGFPADLHNMDEWRAELDIMIAGFKAQLTISNLEYDFRDKEAVAELQKAKADGFALYAERFGDLWD